MAKKKTTQKAQNGGGGVQAPTDERLLDLLHRIDVTMGEARCTTVEMLTVSRQMTVAALAQICEDNPKASPTALIDEIVDNLRRALTARILQQSNDGSPAFGQLGEA